MNKIIVKNRKAFHEYHVGDTYEAGISLIGSEVKAIREGKINLMDSYCNIVEGECFLLQAHISQYSHKGYSSHDVRRDRKLLLHKREILKIKKKLDSQGSSLIPLKIYWKDNYIKVEIALAKGKKLHDKRHDLAEKDAKRQIERQMKRR
ncbi:MAG: SsrA-binding protein SmpB [Candidatus Marinimicrobia bacterium]|nr:SsrA-binding protein SmpB [Candidatus Neomarinimicrobiota bacterium]